MALYIGTNYHPHDWDRDRWKEDIRLMKDAGFTTARIGHLCWDSYEPEEGVYTFEWMDEAMDLFAEAGIGVVLDITMRPAPVWVHKLCPGCAVHDTNGLPQPSIRRYMEDVADPAYQHYALRFAEIFVKRYRDHPALFAFGLCNEIGSGKKSFSESSRQRFIQWLKHKYGTVGRMNEAWATRRWCRRLNSFDEVAFPENSIAIGAPEAWLDMRRFFADGAGEFLVRLKETAEAFGPGIPHSSNHYAELDDFGFDSLGISDRFVDYPGIGFYPGFQVAEPYYYISSIYHQRLAETDQPMWCLEFQSGGEELHHGPYGAVRMMAMLCLLNRAQMILGWTWRSMLAGEEQYLCGILGHDGLPTVNYREYQEIACYMKKLQDYAFPYLPVPDTAVAFSYDNGCVTQYGARHYQQSYRRTRVEIEKVFFELNRDFNIICLKNQKHAYKLLLLPEYVLVSEEEATAIREFVADGGTVIMTAYSATVDEHNQVFSEPLPGRLSDVFGIRVAGYERANAKWREPSGDAGVMQVRMGDAEFYIDVDYYEELELHTAKAYAVFPETGQCAVSVNTYGKGMAFYTAPETSAEILKMMIEQLTPALGLKEGPDVPNGIQAREITEGQKFYVNTTDREVRIQLDKPGKGILSAKKYGREFLLAPRDAELIVE